MSNPLLKVKSLSVNYGENCSAISNIDLEINEKEIVCIVGESGSGKTTLIRTIINLLSSGGCISNGSILFNNQDLINSSVSEWENIRGREIFMIFQNAGDFLSPCKKIKSQFVECLRANMSLSREEAKEKAIDALKKVNLYDHHRIMSSYPYQLSGGMKQRISIAMAIAFQPRLILADEPTSALDVITQTQIIHQLKELKNMASVLIVTHNITCAVHIADKIVVMKEKKIVEIGTKEEILLNPKSEYTKELLSTVPKLKGRWE